MSPGSQISGSARPGEPLQVIGAINAYHALMAKRVASGDLLSGGGVAAARSGPAGSRHLQPRRRPHRHPAHHRRVRPAAARDVDNRLRRSAFNVARTTRSLIKFGAAALHIEDQVGAKRCGHRRARSWSREEIVRPDQVAVMRAPIRFRDHGRTMRSERRS